jgi:FixJ family two-component response regulator
VREVRIAVVDDDNLVRNATMSLLRSMGYVARSYSSAVSFMKDDTTDIDFVLSDYQMPEMTGLELLASLHDRPKPIPVVIMTAYTGGGISEKATRLGAAGFIQKPIDEDALVSAIETALASRMAE